MSAVSPRLPVWVRKPARHSAAVVALKRDLRRLRLNTVCESARCPNLHECFSRGAATFLILGNRCTRSCAFCAAAGRHPDAPLRPPDPGEPAAVAGLAASLGLRYVVVTSVTRDDLPDGGAAHFSSTLRHLRAALPRARFEVLVPDFAGAFSAAAVVLDSPPDVFGHNLETVPRLYPQVRPQALYDRSLELLASARRHRPAVLTKSGLMVGLGEQPHEVEETLRDLRDAAVDIVTIGQYLQPTRRNLPVGAFIPPAQFDAWRDCGLSLGFKAVFSGPLVRSSYLADTLWTQAARELSC